jgi:hypothetical protein
MVPSTIPGSVYSEELFLIQIPGTPGKRNNDQICDTVPVNTFVMSGRTCCLLQKLLLCIFFIFPSCTQGATSDLDP